MNKTNKILIGEFSKATSKLFSIIDKINAVNADKFLSAAILNVSIMYDQGEHMFEYSRGCDAVVLLNSRFDIHELADDLGTDIITSEYKGSTVYEVVYNNICFKLFREESNE